MVCIIGLRGLRGLIDAISKTVMACETWWRCELRSHALQSSIIQHNHKSSDLERLPSGNHDKEDVAILQYSRLTE